MTAAEYRAKVKSARREVKHFTKLRNAWRRIVRRRARQAREAAERRKARNKPHVIGNNRVAGGKPRERIAYLCDLALREFRLYYSEQGSWYSRLWAIVNVPSDIWRSDCSSWAMNAYRACGLQRFIKAADYGNTAGNTTSLAEHGREVSREFAESHAGVAVIFYEGTECLPAQSIHVGLSKGNGTDEIWQHGQEPVEGGTFDEFGEGYGVRYFDFLTA